MKKKALLIVPCCMLLWLSNCGTEEKKDTVQTVELHPDAETVDIGGTDVQPDGGTDNKPEADPAEATAAPDPETDDPSGVSDAGARKDGERFPKTIMLEGMEETVNYEHVRNEILGIELDYEYETFVRKTENDAECFVSLYDDQDKPVNYLEVRHETGDSDAVLAEIKTTLSNDFETINEEIALLDGAGDCVLINAFGANGNKLPADSMQRIFIIPADNGCIVAEAHFTIESAEGFGARFSAIVDTITLLK